MKNEWSDLPEIFFFANQNRQFCWLQLNWIQSKIELLRIRSHLFRPILELVNILAKSGGNKLMKVWLMNENVRLLNSATHASAIFGPNWRMTQSRIHFFGQFSSREFPFLSLHCSLLRKELLNEKKEGNRNLKVPMSMMRKK